MYQQSEEGDDLVDFNVDVPPDEDNETIAQPPEFAESEVPDLNDHGDSVDLDATITADYEAID